jgi:hypothetical protein
MLPSLVEMLDWTEATSYSGRMETSNYRSTTETTYRAVLRDEYGASYSTPRDTYEEALADLNRLKIKNQFSGRWTVMSTSTTTIMEDLI